MKELNLIALLGFYILYPHKVADLQPSCEQFAPNVIVAHSQPYSEKLSHIYYLNQKEILHKTADAATQTVEPVAAIIFSESKPIIQNGKRFVRPKIPFVA